MKNNYDAVIAGAGIGGVLAAFRLAEKGKRVFLSEETDWLGGQLTSQAVPSDEHRWIEKCGCTSLYREFRNKVRAHYKSDPALKEELRQQEHLNPGKGWVSAIAHEPKVSLAILSGMLQPYIDGGLIEYRIFTVPVSAETEGDRVKSVTFKNLKSKEQTTVFASFFIDATECGDLLPLTGAEYVCGAESRGETGEPSAPLTADYADMQPVTWVAALSLADEGEDYISAKPEEYDFFKSAGVTYDDNKLLSWYIPDNSTKRKRLFSMFGDDPNANPAGLWTYRRIVCGDYFTDGRKDVSLINWPQNDYSFGNIIDDENAEYHKKMAKQLTKCLVYWLQTEAPRPGGGKGYRVKLRGDIVGTDDGLAKAPYIRESRRIKAVTVITEKDVSKAYSTGIVKRHDSVGIGHYTLDLHPTTKSGTFMNAETYPFELPLGALIPVRLKNLIPACKNAGCTHLTNGCFRLHPIEWNIGEVAGLLSAYCIDKNIQTIDVLNNFIGEFQDILIKNGIELHWQI